MSSDNKALNDAQSVIRSARSLIDSCKSYRQSLYNQCNNVLTNTTVELENLYINSWSASKIIDIPVEDMLMKPRIISGLYDDQNLSYDNFTKSLKLNTKIENLVKASRLYGTAFLVMICDDDILQNPLSANARLINLLNFRASDCEITIFDTNISSPNFMNPVFYKFNINNGSTSELQVHYTRVIRVDHIDTLSVNGWEVAENIIGGNKYRFGMSELIRCFNPIKNEKDISNAVNRLVSESSIPILKAQNLEEALAGEIDAFENKSMTLDKFVSNINDAKSVFNTILLGDKMDMSRLSVNFGGLPEIFDRFNQQLAAVADIPMTRFFAQSAKGLNNGGEVDLSNYYTKIQSMQQNVLTPIYDQLDLVIKSSLGFDSYDYTYPPLWVQSASEKATADLANAQRDQIYLVNGVLNAQEIKTNLYDGEIYQGIEKDIDPSATIDIDNLNRVANG